MDWSAILFWTAVIGGILFADRLLLWAEAQGWIYYRKTKNRTGGTLGNAMLEIQSMIDPPAKYVVEERQREVEDERESGAPETPGSPAS